jgi:hypothetical protein
MKAVRYGPGMPCQQKVSNHKEVVMSNSTRKLIAGVLVVLIVWPLAFGALTLLAINSWILDRNFYVNLLDDSSVYDPLLSQDFPQYVNSRWFPQQINSDLPPAALDKALREVMTPQYLRDQAVGIVNQAFDALEGRTDTFDLSLDFAPVKAALQGDGGARFASVLAAQLPACAAGAEPQIAGSTLIRCRAADVSVADATQQIVTALPAFIDKVPDQISLSRQPINVQAEWRPFNLIFLGNFGLSMAVTLMIGVLAVVWLIAAFVGGTNRRERLLWLGWSLLVPAGLVLIGGIALSSPLISPGLYISLDQSRFALEGVSYSAALRQAIIDTANRAASAVSGGFVWSGLVATAIALGLIIWGALTRSEPQPTQVAASTPASSASKTS